MHVKKKKNYSSSAWEALTPAGLSHLPHTSSFSSLPLFSLPDFPFPAPFMPVAVSQLEAWVQCIQAKLNLC